MVTIGKFVALVTLQQSSVVYYGLDLITPDRGFG